MAQHIPLQYYDLSAAHSISITSPPPWHPKSLFPLDTRFRLGFLLVHLLRDPSLKKNPFCAPAVTEEHGHWTGGWRRCVKPLHIHLKRPRKCSQMTNTRSKQVTLWETAQVWTLKNFSKNFQDCHFPIRMVIGSSKMGLMHHLWPDGKDDALVSARRGDGSSLSRGKHWRGLLKSPQAAGPRISTPWTDENNLVTEQNLTIRSVLCTKPRTLGSCWPLFDLSHCTRDLGWLGHSLA